MSASPSRMPLIDSLKGVAAQLIVLHHLAFYGPMSDVAYPLAVGAIDWMYDFGRMAVQVFLVIAGFLAAKSLAPAACPKTFNPLHLIWSRYRRLAIPLFAALLASMLAAALARHWMVHSSIPDAPQLLQVLAHAFLLQHLLGQDSLSAGVWYIAIDFQLFAMLALALWLASKCKASTRAAVQVVALLGLASLFYFNLQEGRDNLGIYFFGSYALGVTAQWATQRQHSSAWFAVILGLVTCAMLVDFRLRIVIALCTALSLGLSGRYQLMQNWQGFRLTAWLGKISYSIFLIHFPVCLLVNTLIFRLAPNSAVINLAGILLAWLLSIASGDLFYRLIESKVGAPRRKVAPKPLVHPEVA